MATFHLNWKSHENDHELRMRKWKPLYFAYKAYVKMENIGQVKWFNF